VVRQRRALRLAQIQKALGEVVKPDLKSNRLMEAPSGQR
jgi:hypothetical protein